MEVVTASGDVVHASETENPDLFWAIRGGSGNFGIVTAFECRLFDIPPVTSGWMYFDLADAQKVMEIGNTVMQQASNDLTIWFYIDMPASVVFAESEEERRRPAAGQSERVLGARIIFTGDPASLDAELKELRACDSLLNERFEPRDYYELQTEIDGLQKPVGFMFMFSAHARDLNRALIEELVATSSLKPANEYDADGSQKRVAYVIAASLGGAVSKLPEDAMAYPGRSALWLILMECATSYPEERDRYRALVRETYRRFKPHLDLDTSWLNQWVDPGTIPLSAVYGQEKLEKLRAIKRKWDPDNLFSHNANIAP
jgi:FAD/FMN-containing dehydrogenase